MLEILLAPFVACLVLAGIHCYLGLHVIMRGVIFVDLALAQIAALGVAAGTIAGAVPHSGESYAWSLGFTLVGAAIFALGRMREQRVPQEAVIGIVYAVSTALMFLILSRSAVDREEIEHMMVGRLLFVDWHEIWATVGVYLAIAVVHVVCRRPFFAISRGEFDHSGLPARLWDFLFYASFGIVVASSVQIAGVLLVFSFLIVPAACASLLWGTVRARLLAGWGFGLAGSMAGVYASAQFDFPTGASVVVALGALFGGSTLIASLRRTEPS